MKILLPDIHKTLTRNLCVFLDRLGHEAVIPSNYNITHYPKPPVQQWLFNNSWTDETAKKEFGPNVKVLNKQEILDYKPDVLLITNYESQFEILSELAPNLPNAKVAFYSGNAYWDGFFDHYKYQNLIYADTTSAEIAKKYKLKNASYWKPFIHSDEPFKPSLQIPIKIYSFINGYSKNFNREFVFFNKLKDVSKEIELVNIEEKPLDEVNKEQLACTAGMSVKGLEGFGFSNIELMSKGRPVLLHRTCCQGKSLLDWSKNFQTCLFFESGADYKEIVDFMLETPENILCLQENCYKRIRQLINSEEQAYILKNFLERLI